MPTALTFDDCEKLCAQGLMSKEEALECLKCHSGPMQETNPIDLKHMGLDSEWETGNSPLHTPSLTGRDPPVPGVMGSGVTQSTSLMSVSGRAPNLADLRITESGDDPAVQKRNIAIYASAALGLVGLYVAVQALKA